MKNIFKAKVIYIFNLKTLSPLSIGGDFSTETNHDIITHNNVPFIPASSIAGSFFSKSEKAYELFGIIDDDHDDFINSNIFISDGEFDLSSLHIDIRDGNAIASELKKHEGEKIKENKFDCEMIQNDTKWSFFIEYSIVANEEEKLDDEISKIVQKINKGIYRLGYKQNRGFGKQVVTSVQKKKFDKSNYNEYLNFNYTLDESYNIKIEDDMEDNRISIVMPVKLISPLSVSDYSTIKGKADSSPIRGIINGEATLADVPGTTINGVITSRVLTLMQELNISLEDKRQHVVDELYIKGNFLTYTRNAINRFSGGTMNGALFTKEVLTPTDKSEGIIKFSFKHKELSVIALYYLALCDLANGYISLGSGSSIGQGIFEAKEEIKLVNVDKTSLIKALKEAKVECGI